METNLVGHLLELVDDADRNNDGRIDLEEWKIMGIHVKLRKHSHANARTVSQIKKKVPMAATHLSKVRDLFERYDNDKDDSLDLNELALLLQELSSKITPLPAV